MTQERLCNAMLVYINKDEDIDLASVAKEFASSNERRINFLDAFEQINKINFCCWL